MTLKLRGIVSLAAVAFILIWSAGAFCETIQYLYDDARQLTGVIYGDGTESLQKTYKANSSSRKRGFN